MQSLKVLNLGFNDISGAILVHLKGNLLAYIEFDIKRFIVFVCLIHLWIEGLSYGS